MKRTDNLKSLGERTTKEQREIARKGGKASVAARQRRKQLRELLEEALAMPAKDRDGTKAESIAVALVERAEKGDTRAFELVRDTLGEKPTAQVDVTSSDGSMSAPATMFDVSRLTPQEIARAARALFRGEAEG